MARNQNWSRDELIVAFNLYCKTPFTKINASNLGVRELSAIIGRSYSAVALKLANFARLDPALRSRNISGMSHGGKGEIEIWQEFNGNWTELSFESELILARYLNRGVEEFVDVNPQEIALEGYETESIVKTRVNQNFFRKAVLASYDNKCCITGLPIPELLIASHIVPWSVDIRNRVNPCNGICLNALHDRAFDAGLITITTDYVLAVSPLLKERLKRGSRNATALDSQLLLDGVKVQQPQKFKPHREFLEYHNINIFKDH